MSLGRNPTSASRSMASLFVLPCATRSARSFAILSRASSSGACSRVVRRSLLLIFAQSHAWSGVQLDGSFAHDAQPCGPCWTWYQARQQSRHAAFRYGPGWLRCHPVCGHPCAHVRQGGQSRRAAALQLRRVSQASSYLSSPLYPWESISLSAHRTTPRWTCQGSTTRFPSNQRGALMQDGLMSRHITVLDRRAGQECLPLGSGETGLRTGSRRQAEACLYPLRSE